MDFFSFACTNAVVGATLLVCYFSCTDRVTVSLSVVPRCGAPSVAATCLHLLPAAADFRPGAFVRADRVAVYIAVFAIRGAQHSDPNG